MPLRHWREGDELRTCARRCADAQGKRRAAEGKWADIAVLEPVRDYKAPRLDPVTFDAWSTPSIRSRQAQAAVLQNECCE